MYSYNNKNLSWKGDELFVVGRRKPVLRIVPDARYPTMWRVQRPDGSLSDMANRTRAKDAARSVALGTLNASAQSCAA
jgi:hypothetical protein